MPPYAFTLGGDACEAVILTSQIVAMQKLAYKCTPTASAIESTTKKGQSSTYHNETIPSSASECR